MMAYRNFNNARCIPALENDIVFILLLPSASCRSVFQCLGQRRRFFGGRHSRDGRRPYGGIGVIDPSSPPRGPGLDLNAPAAGSSTIGFGLQAGPITSFTATAGGSIEAGPTTTAHPAFTFRTIASCRGAPPFFNSVADSTRSTSSEAASMTVPPPPAASPSAPSVFNSGARRQWTAVAGSSATPQEHGPQRGSVPSSVHKRGGRRSAAARRDPAAE